MNDSTNEGKGFSKDVNEKISTVFQNFAVNPVVENIGKDIKSLDEKIFGKDREDEQEKSLQEQITDNAQCISKTVKDIKTELQSSKDNISEEMSKLDVSLKGIKGDIENFKKENQEKRQEKGEEICQKISSIVKEINNQAKGHFDDLTKQNKNDSDKVIQAINSSDKALKDEVASYYNEIEKQIQKINEQSQIDYENLTKAIEDNRLQMEKAIDEISEKKFKENEALIQRDAQKTREDLLENMTGKYNEIKKLIIGLLISNGVLIGAAITVILLLILKSTV